MTPSRAKFIEFLISKFGAAYIWDAKGDNTFDCSGLPTCGFYRIGGPDWRATHNCAVLWRELKSTDIPRGGTLCLYGTPEAPEHVMVHLAEGVVIGASGGGSKTTTVALAKAQGACVKIQSTYLYRKDFIGFRELPFV